MVTSRSPSSPAILEGPRELLYCLPLRPYRAIRTPLEEDAAAVRQALKVLEQQGLVKVDYGVIEVFDLEGLRQYGE